MNTVYEEKLYEIQGTETYYEQGIEKSIMKILIISELGADADTIINTYKSPCCKSNFKISCQEKTISKLHYF